MHDRQNFFFKIDACELADMPAERVAEYIKNLAILLGHKQDVHFESLQSGSVALVCSVERSCMEKATQRVRDASRGQGPARAVAAYRRIAQSLQEDQSPARLSDADSEEIIRFPQGDDSAGQECGPFEEEDVADGVVVRIGGLGKIVPVWLQSGNTKIICMADRDMAKQLAPHLFGKELRVFGMGLRFRDKNGKWKTLRFVIQRFVELNDTPLPVLLERLRAVPGNGWEKLDDPWGELQRERED